MSQNGRTISPRSRHDDRASPSTVAIWSIKSLADSQSPGEGPRAISGCVLHREGDHIQQGSDTMQERLHRAGAWQMKEDAILILFDLGGDFEEGEDDRRGLSLGEGGLV